MIARQNIFPKRICKLHSNFQLLSLDILNFVPVTDLNYYIRWIEHNVQYLCDLIDPHSGNFYTFEQTRNKLNTKIFINKPNIFTMNYSF
jgi:hypothetical protein